jgi:hypothetical protein
MKLVLSKQDVLTAIYTAMCDGGINLLRCNGYELTFNDTDFIRVKKMLIKVDKYFCDEDVYIEMIRLKKPFGFQLIGSNIITQLTLVNAIRYFKRIEALTCLFKVLNVEGNYNSQDCLNVLQFALFGVIK